MSPWQLCWCPWCGVSWDSGNLILVMAEPEQLQSRPNQQKISLEKEKQSMGITGLAAADFWEELLGLCASPQRANEL